MKNFKTAIVAVIGLLLCSAELSGALLQWHVSPITALLAVLVLMMLFLLVPAKNRGDYVAGVTTQYGLQEAFKRARAQVQTAYIAGGMNAGDAASAAKEAVLSQSYLRLEQPLTTTTNVFNFPILINATGTAAIRATEVRLNQQDAFFCSNIAVYLATSNTTTTLTSFPVLTYPNPTSFPTGSASLYGFYNGFMNITINKSVIVPAYPMLNFLQIPQTQNGVGVTAQTVFPVTQFDPAQVSLWEPTINFIGTKQSNIQITLPGNMTTLDANTFAVISLQGILAQNVTLMS